LVPRAQQCRDHRNVQQLQVNDHKVIDHKVADHVLVCLDHVLVRFVQVLLRVLRDLDHHKPAEVHGHKVAHLSVQVVQLVQEHRQLVHQLLVVHNAAAVGHHNAAALPVHLENRMVKSVKI
jgi:hypothetical protein